MFTGNGAKKLARDYGSSKERSKERSGWASWRRGHLGYALKDG